MNDYEKSKLLVRIYENHTADLFEPTGVDEIDLLRKYLVHDIRLVNVIMSSYAQVENANPEVNFPLPELMRIHHNWREAYDKALLAENDFLSIHYERNKGVFTTAANFYLKRVYESYGIDEDIALDIISKITGLPKDKLKNARDNNIPPVELEKYLKPAIDFKNRLYEFNTSSIQSEMQRLLEKFNYESLDTEGKINVINSSLKIYLENLIRRIPGGNDFFRDFEKDVEELFELIAVHSSNKTCLWDVINYLLWIIGTFKKPINLVICGDSDSEEYPNIDLDKLSVFVQPTTDPVVVFKLIYEKLFNIQFLEKGPKLEKK